MSKTRFMYVLLALFAVIALVALRITNSSAAAIRYQDAQTSSGDPIELQLLNPTQDLMAVEEIDSSVAENNQVAIKASDQLKDIIARWETKTLKSGEWVHYVYSSKSAVETGVLLPSGEMMTNTYISDGWYLLDQKRLVIQALVTLKDEEGKILQQEGYNKGVDMNLVTGERATEVPPFSFKLDLSYRQDMLEMEAQGIDITSQEVDFRGNASLQFSAKASFAQAVKLSNSPLPVTSIVYTVFFDPQTDALTHAEKVWKLEDGKDVVFEENEILTLEITKAPNDILAILEGVK